MKFVRQLPCVTLAALSACAGIPQGTVTYYYPKAQTTLVITQTLSCNANGDTLRQTVSVTPTTTYPSDTNVTPGTFTPKSIDGALSDTDVALTFSDDGKLTGINTTSTGQGGTVVKDVVTVAAAFGAAAAAMTASPYDAKSACDDIKDFNAKSAETSQDAAKSSAGAAASTAAVTLTYAGTFDLKADSALNVTLVPFTGAAAPKPVSSLVIPPDAGSGAVWEKLAKHIPNLQFAVEPISAATALKAATWSNPSASDPSITLNSVAIAGLQVIGPTGNLQKAGNVWEQNIYMPLTDTTHLYSLPIPKPQPFGTGKFVLTLSAYGSIDKLEYSSSGTSDAADAAAALGNAIAKDTAHQTDAQRATAVQGQADLIYQQQRLAVCHSNPENCPSK